MKSLFTAFLIAMTLVALRPAELSSQHLPEYLFVCDTRDRSFPVRYRILERGEDHQRIRDIKALTATIARDEVQAMVDDLAQQFPKPRYLVERAYGSSWETVQRNFWGAHFYDE